jgi:hypothetical protein
MNRRFPVLPTLTVALVAALTLAAATAAKAPKISGTYSMPKGLIPGGFVQHGMVAGPGNTEWVTTETGRGAKTKPVLLRVSASGSITSVKVPASGGISFTGLGLGPHNQVWFSGTAGGGNDIVNGTTAHVATQSGGPGSWDELAVVGDTAYATTGFDVMERTTDNATFANVQTTNVSAWDVVPFAGQLAVAGDGAIGLLAPSALAGTSAAATLLTGPVPLGSREEAVAGGKLWFMQTVAGRNVVGLGVAGPDGAATLHSMSGLRQLTAGPDNAPWVLTNTKAIKIGPTGNVAASVKLPAGQAGILIGGASSKYVWVATLNRASGRAKLVRISVG